MPGTRTVVIAAIVAFAAGAALTVLTTSSGGAPETESAASADAASTDAAPEVPAAKRTRRTERGASPTPLDPGAQGDPAPGWIADLRPSQEECDWLRSALVAERERRNVAVIRPEDTGVDVMRRYLRHGADAEPVLASFDAARRHVPSPEGEPVRFNASADGKPVDLAAAAGASILEFGPGRFDLRETRHGFLERSKPVAALEIRGAGRDATTLVLGPYQQTMILGESQSVVVRDLTIECPDGDVTPFDVRGGASFAFERVRFAGWLSGAGYSAVLGIAGQGLVACRDCEFLAGGGGGFVLSLRGPGLAVFERCRFADTESVFIAGGAGSGGRPSAVRVLGCEFESTRLADSRIRRGENDEVDLRVRGGTVALLGAKATDDQRRKAWGAEFAATVESVVFSAAAPRSTGAQLLRVLELAEARGWSPIAAAALFPAPRGTPLRFELYVAAETRIDRKVVDLVDGALVDVERDQSSARGVQVSNAGDLAGLRSLRALLASVPDVAGEEIESIKFSRGSNSGVQTWALMIEGERGRMRCLVDATSGEILSLRR